MRRTITYVLKTVPVLLPDVGVVCEKERDRGIERVKEGGREKETEAWFK